MLLEAYQESKKRSVRSAFSRRTNGTLSHLRWIRFRTEETEAQEDERENEMKNIVCHIHRHPEHPAHPKSEHGDECVDDTEHLGEYLLPIQRNCEESKHTSQEMHDIVERINFENPEERIGIETESPDDEEHDANGRNNCFLHICDIKNQTIHATYLILRVKRDRPFPCLIVTFSIHPNLTFLTVLSSLFENSGHTAPKAE